MTEQSEDTRASLLERIHAELPADRDKAWTEFCERYAPLIAAFARHCGAGPQDINDIAQEVFTALWGKGSDFVYDQSKGRFRSYLKTITVRVASRLAGKNLKFKGMPFDAVSGTASRSSRARRTAISS